MQQPTRVWPAADILVVDDAPANLQLMAGILEERGYIARLPLE